jgi:hypothetical protein
MVESTAVGEHRDRMREAENQPEAHVPREAIARNPRRAWPLVAIVGVPVGITIAFSVAIGGMFPGDKFGSVVASVAALPLMLVGTYTLVFPTRGRGRALVFLGLAAVAFVAGFVRDSRVPGNYRPAGWSSSLPQYPGLLVEAQACGETEGGGTFRTLSGGGKGRLPVAVTYERALREAGIGFLLPRETERSR